MISESISFANTAVHLSLTVVVWLFSAYFGRVLVDLSAQYNSISNVFEPEQYTGFNAVYRILVAPISIVFFSIILYSLNLDEFTNNIWHVSVLFFLVQVVILSLLDRWRLVNKKKFIFFNLMSILVSFYVYDEAILNGLEFLLPDSTNIKTEIWIVILAFLYGVVNKTYEPIEKFHTRQRQYINHKKQFFISKYMNLLRGEDEIIKKIVLSIMIHEDFNRPLFARVVEGIIGASSKGVMQFKGARNDVESINSAIKFVRKESRKVPASTIDNYELMLASAVVNIAQKYNPHDKNYPYQVLEIFEKISN